MRRKTESSMIDYMVRTADIEEEDGQHFDIVFGLAYCHYIEELCEEED